MPSPLRNLLVSGALGLALLACSSSNKKPTNSASAGSDGSFKENPQALDGLFRRFLGRYRYYSHTSTGDGPRFTALDGELILTEDRVIRFYQTGSTPSSPAVWLSQFGAHTPLKPFLNESSEGILIEVAWRDASRSSGRQTEWWYLRLELGQLKITSTLPSSQPDQKIYEEEWTLSNTYGSP